MENKREIFALSILWHLFQHLGIWLVSLFFVCPYSLSCTFSLYLFPSQQVIFSLQKRNQVPGITHFRGHTLRQPGGVLFSFYRNSGAFCCGPGNVLVSKCVHTYVWCLVVQQFDQSTDAKVWRAKWPLHSQTHTAAANLEMSWKIISSCYDQQTCWKLEERIGEEELTDLSWHWVWNITRPRTSHQGVDLLTGQFAAFETCYLMANYSVRKMPHSHTIKHPKTNTNPLKDKSKRKANKGVGERSVNCFNSIREPLPHSSLSLSSHQTYYQHCRRENKEGQPSATLNLERTNENEMKVKFSNLQEKKKKKTFKNTTWKIQFAILAWGPSGAEPYQTQIPIQLVP